MKIVADENIPWVRKAFASWGDVHTLPGRTLTAEDVQDADVLLVRSITRVGGPLLEGSRVCFLGTATVGVDHVDLDYLRKHDIGFTNAPASNAVSAAEYVISALLVMAERGGFSLADQTVGIVGCGNVGSRVLTRLEALGVRCLVNDPPKEAQQRDRQYVSLDEIRTADIITLHVPLERFGQHPTYHLFDEDFFTGLKPGALFLNAARGSVVDEAGLKRTFTRRADLSLALDVWEGEPAIDRDLLVRADIGTAHIAGYSLDGKIRGTEMIYRAACAHFGIAPTWQAAKALPPPPLTQLHFSRTASDEQVIRQTVLAAYDVRRDDAALRRMRHLPNPMRARYFDRLRKDYPPRREFASLRVFLPTGRDALAGTLAGLGFQVQVG